jgi:hypothetical protein
VAGEPTEPPTALEAAAIDQLDLAAIAESELSPII